MQTKNIVKLLTLTLICLISMGGSANAAEFGGISGQVVDIDSKLPVVGAKIVLEGGNQNTITDFTGRFIFEKVKPGNYSLQITHVNFQNERRADIRVRAGETVELNISLTRITIGKFDFDLGDLSIVQSPQRSSSSPDEVMNEREESGRDRVNYKATGQGAGTSSNYITPRPVKDVPHTKIRPEAYYEIPETPYDMFFRDYGTNGFVPADRDHLSTFAADVDDASYTLARKYITEGFTPPEDAIRVEEFINHFQYGYKPPEHKKFQIFTELAASPFNSQMTLMKIGIKGREIMKRERRPMNLTLVIDVSGSMGYDNRMELVKNSLRLLVDQLNSRDRVGMVTYGSDARVVLEPVSGDRAEIIYRAIDRLYPGGSTFAEAGIKLGYKMADRQFARGHNNTLVLCSDGVANVGNIMADDIMSRINKYTDRGITLSAFGFGMGNYNDVLLEQLAVKGNGKYAYVNDINEAEKVFVEDFVGNFQVLARDVKIQVDFNPEIVESYRLLGYENRDVADNKFRDNREDGGEIGAGHEVTAIYEIVLSHRRVRGDMATVNVRWKNVEQSEVTEVSQTVRADKNIPSLNRQRPEFKLAVVSAKFAEILKGTVYAENISFRELYRMASSLVEDMPGEQTEELLDLIRRAGNFDRDFSRR